jgi:hypothetical protein
MLAQPTGSRRATPLHLFQHRSGHSQKCSHGRIKAAASWRLSYYSSSVSMASTSFSSDISRFFTGSPTDKAIRMLVGGVVAFVVGVVGLLQG